MPFESQAQRSWMYANHPDMAKRWEQETPKGPRLPRRLGFKGAANPKSESNDSPAPSIKRLRHKAADDFKGLSPSASARFKLKHQNQQQSDKESGVEAFPNRDARKAAAKKARKR